ncbi:MAG: hypothetical protein VYD19_01355 [Myxococcota bacterium]|nr:hypothetical protein [Myxococcota bacterium]
MIITAALPTTAIGEEAAEDANEHGCQRDQRRCRLRGLTAIEREQLSALPERESYLFELQLNQRELQSLGRLSWMRRLDLSRSQIKNLEPITSLARLSELRIDGIKEVRLSLKPLSALSQLKRLSFANTRVSDEAEIAALTQLQELSFYRSDIRDLSFARELESLESLDLYACERISDYGPLRSLRALRRLNLYMSRAPQEAFSVLATLPMLEEIGLQFSKVESLSFLAGASQLRRLDASWARSLTTIDDLIGLPALEDLSLIDAPIESIEEIGELRALRQLDLSGTKVIDLRPLSLLTQLEQLKLAQSAIVDLRPLAALQQLRVLDLAESEVSDLRPVADLRRLTNLSLSGAPLTDLRPLSELTGLQILNVSESEVADLRPLSSLTGLIQLNLAESRVSDTRPLAQLTQLQYLNLSGTPLQDPRPLFNLRSLRWLKLPAGVPQPLRDQLRKTLPKLTLHYDDETAQGDDPSITDQRDDARMRHARRRAALLNQQQRASASENRGSRTRARKRRERRHTPGQLRLSGPRGAKVYIDGRFRGRLPRGTYYLSPGSHQIRCVYKGREKKRRVSVAVGRKKRVRCIR